MCIAAFDDQTEFRRIAGHSERLWKKLEAKAERSGKRT